MANEINVTGLSGSYSTEYRVAADSFIEALYENARMLLGFLKRKSLAGFHSTTERFPKRPKLAASSIADGVDMVNTPYAPSYVNITVGEVGLMLTLTDLARTSSLQDAAEYGMEMGEAISEKLLADIANLMGGFSRTVGSTGVNLTEAQFLDARVLLHKKNIKEPYVSLLETQQLYDLVADVGTTIDALKTSGLGVRQQANDLVPRSDQNYGVLFNTSIFWSNKVPTANAGADSAGGMFGAGRAIGLVDKWTTRMEGERDASLRAQELVGTSAYGVGELDDDAGVAIITDR